MATIQKHAWINGLFDSFHIYIYPWRYYLVYEHRNLVFFFEVHL